MTLYPMKARPILEQFFYRNGRGPELQRAVWSAAGITLLGFEYFNLDDVYQPESLKHLKLAGVEAYSMAGEEVHRNPCVVPGNRAAIWLLEESTWLSQFQQRHLVGCCHYQIMFYDEIYDIICKEIIPGQGPLPTNGYNSERASQCSP